MKFLHLALAFALLYNVTGRPGSNEDYDPDFALENEDSPVQNDEYDYGESENTNNNDREDEDESSEPPSIFTEGQTFIVYKNDVVHLPCNRSHSHSVVTMWKKDGTPIFQDAIPLAKDRPHLNLSKDGTLVIYNASANDAGSYECRIYSKEERFIVHQVKLAQEPKITSLTAQNEQLKAGGTLKLTCEVTGLPTPRITWSKDGKSFPIHNKELVIENVAHENNGVYQCLADNKAGIAHEHITITVTHKPIVRIERVLPGSPTPDQPFELVLQCIVHGTPESKVTWLKDSTVVESDSHVQLQQEGNSHNLIIKAVGESDYGKYKCHAKNTLGEAEKAVIIEGQPSIARFEDRTVVKDGAHGVKITWKVDSIYPLTQYTIMFRSRKSNDWIAEEKTEFEAEKGTSFIITHLFIGLEAGEYEAKLKTKNVQGESDFSKIVKFEIKKHHNHHDSKSYHVMYEKTDQPATAQEQTKPKIEDDRESVHDNSPAAESSTGGSGNLIAAVWLICIAEIVLLQRQ